jgi:hypothetical protein
VDGYGKLIDAYNSAAIVLSYQPSRLCIYRQKKNMLHKIMKITEKVGEKSKQAFKNPDDWMAVVLGFLILRIRHVDNYTFKWLWLAESVLFSVLAIAFMVRRDPVDRSRGAAEIIVPFIGSMLPFGLLVTQQSVWVIENKVLMTAVFSWMSLVTAFTAWGMWVLRRSFRITVEARLLVTRGGPITG